MEKINIKDLFILIFYCMCILCCTVMLAYLIAPTIIYFKVGVFNIDWKIVLTDSLKKGCVGGIILGIGIWLKGKLKERQSRKGGE
ncbi:hypothetical protein V8O11_20120 [Erwinia aphidicola]|uniref:hypothetical protein n=1 Tax=Erwinia aphidicola TaxID=68334 RepID=UPI00300C6AEC